MLNFKSKHSWENILIVVIGIALTLAVRLSLLAFETGDYNAFKSWYRFVQEHGGFCALKHNFSDYSPPYLYLLVVGSWLHLPDLWLMPV